MRLFQALRRVPTRSEPSIMSGRGSRGDINKPPTGLSIKDLKHHYALVPLVVIMSFGGVLFFGNIWRACAHVPDVNFFKVQDPEDRFRYRDAKMVDVTGADFKELGKAIPDYKST